MKGLVMKKIVLITTTVCLTLGLNALSIEVDSGDAFKKVMSKNRAAKNMEGSNYVEIKSSKELAEHRNKDLGITIDKDTKNGTIYNYVDIKNAKVKKDKPFSTNRKGTNKYNVKNKSTEGRNIGVKIKTGEGKGFDRGFKGRVVNQVKIENSELD